MRERAAQDAPLYAIASECNARGWTTPRGAKWIAQGVQYALEGPQ